MLLQSLLSTSLTRWTMHRYNRMGMHDASRHSFIDRYVCIFRHFMKCPFPLWTNSGASKIHSQSRKYASSTHSTAWPFTKISLLSLWNRPVEFCGLLANHKSLCQMAKWLLARDALWQTVSVPTKTEIFFAANTIVCVEQEVTYRENSTFTSSFASSSLWPRSPPQSNRFVTYAAIWREWVWAFQRSVSLPLSLSRSLSPSLPLSLSPVLSLSPTLLHVLHSISVFNHSLDPTFISQRNLWIFESWIIPIK